MIACKQQPKAVAGEGGGFRSDMLCSLAAGKVTVPLRRDGYRLGHNSTLDDPGHNHVTQELTSPGSAAASYQKGRKEEERDEVRVSDGWATFLTRVIRVWVAFYVIARRTRHHDVLPRFARCHSIHYQHITYNILTKIIKLCTADIYILLLSTLKPALVQPGKIVYNSFNLNQPKKCK